MNMEIIETIKAYIKPEMLILIPVLYLIGIGIKKSNLKDCVIPFVLGGISILLSALYLFATSDITGVKDIAMAIFVAITQGILIAGASVYINQLFKQANKTE
jgi:hypothetical protein